MQVMFYFVVCIVVCMCLAYASHLMELWIASSYGIVQDTDVVEVEIQYDDQQRAVFYEKDGTFIACNKPYNVVAQMMSEKYDYARRVVFMERVYEQSV